MTHVPKYFVKIPYDDPEGYARIGTTLKIPLKEHNDVFLGGNFCICCRLNMKYPYTVMIGFSSLDDLLLVGSLVKAITKILRVPMHETYYVLILETEEQFPVSFLD